MARMDRIVGSADDTAAAGTRSVLMIGRNPVMREALARIGAADPSIELYEDDRPLAEIAVSNPGLVRGYETVVIEDDPAAGDNRAAFATLVAAGAPQVRFIAVIPSDNDAARKAAMMTAGAAAVVPVSADTAALADAIGAVHPRRLSLSVGQPAPGSAPGRRGRLIAVTKARGGIGATSVAVNLAWSLLDRQGLLKKAPRHTVALVDLDIQFGNAGIFLDVEDRGAMIEIMQAERAPDAQFLRGSLIEHPSGLSILTAPSQAAPLDGLDRERVGAIIDTLLADFDYVVVDLPPALVPWLDAILSRADRLLMVTDLAVPSVRQAKRVCDFLSEDHPTMAIDIVVNREASSIFSTTHQKEAAKALGRPLKYWIPDDTRAARLAIDRGAPVAEVASGSGFAKAVAKMAKGLMSDFETAGGRSARKGTN